MAGEDAAAPHERPQGPSTNGSRARPRAGGVARPLLLYTALRVALFLAVLVVVSPFVSEPLLALGAAVLGSALLSVPLLKRQRHAVNVATAERTQARLEARRQRRARLDRD